MKWLVLVAIPLAVAGCNKDDHGPTGHSHGGKKTTKAAGTTGTAADHGSEVALGQLAIGGVTLQVAQLGEIAAGRDGAVAAKVTKTADGADWRKLNLYMWVESATGERLTAPSKAAVEEGRLHLHASLPKGSAAAARLIFRLRGSDQDVREALALPGAATVATKAAALKPTHKHEKTPHDGVVAPLQGTNGDTAGWVELKLHDDKGDLELWLATDKAMTKPLDLALEARPSVKFVDHKGRVIELAVRDKTANNDEDGKGNIRGKTTNYFIFPGDSGADAKWLMGKKFQSIVVTSVTTDSGLFKAELMLRPHTHAPGTEH